MTIGRARTSVLVAVMLAAMLCTSSADAAIARREKCLLATAKASQKFLAGKLKLLQKCRNADLKDGSCDMPDPDAVTKLSTKLANGLTKACSLTEIEFQQIGFPGPCSDVTPLTDFTVGDLAACMETSHDAFVTAAMGFAYDATLPPTLGSEDLACQVEVAKQNTAYAMCLLKSVSKCRDAILKDKPLGVPPDFCATDDAKTSAAIQKCEDKFSAKLAKKCSAAQITSLKVCTPDQTTVPAAVSCLIAQQTVLIDGTEIIVPPDLIDYEYAVRGGLCGDNVVNGLNEECDGPDDSACPGQCGTAETPDGFLACLCKTEPRMVVIEHADADTDNGWLGLSVDGDVVEGGGYLVDLYDCDLSGQCNAGPSCSLPPHSPCGVAHNATSGTTGDSICAFLGQGTCRKKHTATGPHCYQDIQKKCDFRNRNDATCNAPGDYCVTTPHGAPVAAAAGGVAVCNVSIFSEDVVGTVNLTLGTSSLKVRQQAITYGPISQHQPCPVCGGFCGISRDRCDATHPCPLGAGTCIEDAICSNGVREGQSCRRTPPFGGEIPFFGTTSVDCPPNTGKITNQTSGFGLDINANPRTTGTVNLLPTFTCTAPVFNQNVCQGGSNNGRQCAAASECPGGSCGPQCFCFSQSRPNDCFSACLGGPNDTLGCTEDAECPGGFCHPGDCRLNPSDMDSNQEGECSAGPTTNFCSITTYRTCDTALDCEPSPECPYCVGGELCQAKLRQCFINTGIERIGTPGPLNTDRETAGVYCVPSNAGAIDISAGFPGPGALIQRESVIVVP